MKAFRIVVRIFVFALLTTLTQIGGIVYLFFLATNGYYTENFTGKFVAVTVKTVYFLSIYSLTTFFIVPVAARLCGRVQLPLFESGHLRPLNILTCFLNRNYVKLELRQTAIKVAEQMNQKYPGTTLNYLDANFPFLNRFPLFPHLSHDDGKKLDFAFYYVDNKTSAPTNNCPSVIGYGVSEEPRANEQNTAAFCNDKGYWQYSLLKKIIPQGSKTDFLFDSTRTKYLVNLFAAQESIGKIFIEPHLKSRLGLTTDKIRFHGCRAVRHDDHIHVQLR